MESTELRRRAESAPRLDRKTALEKMEPDVLVEELSIHQVQLELQARELEQLESELKRERALRRELFDRSRLTQLVVDQDGAISDANAAAECLLNRPRDRMIGRSLSRLFPDGERVERAFREARETGKPSRLRVKRPGADAKAIELEMSFSALSDGSWLLSIAEQRSPIPFATEPRHILGPSGAPMIAFLPDGSIASVNRAAEKMFGWSSDELIGRRADVLVGDAGSRFQAGDLVGMKKDGTPCPMRVELAKVELAGTTLHVATLFDLTALAPFNEAFDRMDEVFYLIDPTAKRVLYVSQNYERLFGRPHEDSFHFENTLDRIHPDDRAFILAKWNEIGIASRIDVEFRLLHPSGAVRTLSAHAFLLSKTGWVAGTVRDVTELKAIGLELSQAHKMEALGALASGIAHDFNNMLMGIAGFASVALKRLDRMHPAYGVVKRIVEMTGRGTRLVQRLLEFSRNRPPERAPLEIDPMIAESKPLIETLVGEHIQVVVRTEAIGCRVQADAAELEQVLLNLAANSRDAMPHGGVLEVRSEEVKIPPRDPIGLPQGRYALITVRDTGCGMDEETTKRVFDPFFTTKRAGRGTGLGLSNCATIVERLGGRIFASSQLGVGTKISIYLPALPETGEIEIPTGPPSAAVLIVEDDPNVRATVAFYLESLGYQPLAAESAAEAKRLAREQGDRIRVLLADIVMPEELGHELARQIKAEHPNIKVAYMSAHDWDELTREYGVELGAPLLEKPFDERKLGMLLHRLLTSPQVEGA